ncbi:HIT family protein [Bacteroidales bacterium OttesenSCG-928-I14]|nr:HIT family protein [Bacteroidales bacterium OttesenSCG-928-I14]
MSSIFSKIIAGDIPSYKVAENDNYYAFLDINPVAKGHTLVVPKKETDYIFDMDNEDLSGLILFAKEVAKAIEKSIPCQRVGMTVIGLEVPHAHIHLIPINKESDMSFDKERVQLSKEDFEEIASAISKEM